MAGGQSQGLVRARRGVPDHAEGVAGLDRWGVHGDGRRDPTSPSRGLASGREADDPRVGPGRADGSRHTRGVSLRDSLGPASRRIGSVLAAATRRAGRRVQTEMVDMVGGPARAQVIFLFGAVLALASADAATVGAVAGQLEPDLHIGNAKVGLLGSASLVVGAIAVLPVGLLVDRVTRVRLLAGSIVLWSVAMFMSGAAGSYSQLLYSRLALGAVTATAGPAIASLTGDYFSPRERGRVYGYILGGEIAGTAIGFIVSGLIAAALSW